MSNDTEKKKNSSRRYADQVAIEKQMRIARDYQMHQNTKWKYILQPHRNHKMHILNCGNSKCYICGNPRRWFKEITIQEKKFFQNRLHQDDSE